MTSIIHPSKWQISHPVRTDGGSAFDVPKCLWDDRCNTACGVATARDTAGGGDEGMSLLGIYAWNFVKHDIQKQLQIYMCIMCIYIYRYNTCIHVYVHWMYMGCEKIFKWCCMALLKCFRGVFHPNDTENLWSALCGWLQWETHSLDVYGGLHQGPNHLYHFYIFGCLDHSSWQ